MKKTISLLLAVLLYALPLHTAYSAQSYSVLREPIYNMADSFYSNITKVSKNSAWAICDTNGYPLTGYNWEAMGEIVDEYIPAKQGGLWGYISTDGKVRISYQFQKADNFSDGIARVLTADGKYAYINKSGAIAFVSPFDYSFSSVGGAVCGIKNGLYGYCDTTGGIFIHPQFEMGFDFHEGLAAVKFGGLWGYIATDGHYTVKPAYTHAGDFKNGYAVCATSSGYGIIDSLGRKTSAFAFDYIGECDQSGRFPAKAGEKCGYINARGEWLMKFNYDFCYTFTDGVARVYKDGLWGYINESGAELVTPSFVDCGEYRNGRAFYSPDGVTYGFLTLNTQFTPTEPQVPEVVTPVEPSAPAPVEPEVTQPSGSEEEEGIIFDFTQLGRLPEYASEENCISLKIGVVYARKRSNLKPLSKAPQLIDGVTMVPLRDVVEYMNGTVTWNEDAKRINVTCNRNQISVTVGSKICYVNGVAASMSAAPQLIDGVTMIPIRSIAVALGCDVEWVAQTENIFIRY